MVLGHSLGALVAIWLARFGPLRGRIAHVILLDPPLVLDLSVPGQGELLFDLGLNLGAQTPVASPVLPTAEQLRAYGLASFGAERYFQSQGPAGSRTKLERTWAAGMVVVTLPLIVERRRFTSCVSV